MKCNKCGNENSEGLNNCTNCGSPLNVNVTNQQVSPKQKQGTNIALIGIIAVVVIIAIALFGYTTVQKMQNDNEKQLLNTAKSILGSKYIVIKKDGNYGFINSNGKIVLEPQYSDIEETFINGYAVVKKDGNYYVINEKGKEMASASFKSDVEYDENHDIWRVGPYIYTKNFKAINKDKVITDFSDGYSVWKSIDGKQTGIMTPTGKVSYTHNVTDSSYLSIRKSYTDKKLKKEYCAISIDNDSKIINCDSGKVILDNPKSHISSSANNIFEISDKNYNNKKYVFIYKDKVFYESPDRIEYMNGYIYVKESNSSYYININSNKKTEEKPEDYYMNYSFSIVDSKDYTELKCEKDGYTAYGLMKKEKIVLPCEWRRLKDLDTTLSIYLSSLGKKYILGEKNDKYYLINAKNNKIIHEFNTDYISTDESIFIKYKDTNTKKEVIYNVLTNKSNSFDEKSDIDLYGNYFTITNNGKIEYYNQKFKIIYSTTK